MEVCYTFPRRYIFDQIGIWCKKKNSPYIFQNNVNNTYISMTIPYPLSGVIFYFYFPKV